MLNSLCRLMIEWAALLSVVFFATATAQADDWAQWRGSARNGISRETGWLKGWPESGSPKVAWRAAVGKGHSTISVASGRAYTVGWDGSQDTVLCFEAATGKLIWKQSYPSQTILQWPGPRATPTVHDGAVYTLGQHGQLRAWNALTGEPRWQRELPEDYNPDVDYGFAWSPLIEGDVLILNAGSRGLAIRTRDGSIAWGDDQKKGACVSAVPFTHEGRRGVLVVHINDARSEANLVGVDPVSGRELWRWNGWKEQWGAMGVDPVIHDGHLFLTSAQEYRQSARFTIAGDTLKQDWSTNRVAGYTGSAVLLGGHLYLVDSKGILKCVDWNTGKEMWVQRGFDERGTLIAADGQLLIQTGASGKLVIVAADPAGYRELRQTTVFDDNPETYTAPVLANGRIYCRSYAGDVVCLQLDP
ncbi:MAG: PQQ-binding-like beta-propeller repeat protein [Planctomycetaceae bacterium]|nr:PQQ-binding-like beta-propeller repeat protein [Planctomycetaceae bacterium]